MLEDLELRVLYLEEKISKLERYLGVEDNLKFLELAPKYKYAYGLKKKKER